MRYTAGSTPSTHKLISFLKNQSSLKFVKAVLVSLAGHTRCLPLLLGGISPSVAKKKNIFYMILFFVLEVTANRKSSFIY